MKIYAAIVVILSAAFGLVPILFAKFTDQGDELCDPAYYYAPEPTCILVWDRALLAFALYFALAMLFFIVLWLVFRVMRRSGQKR